ncbi:MAG: 30S ribosomal protein S16 [Bacteroidales bacterium]|nr:30S ribosomal protein S16 [Bacteroidales bacterium]NLK82275.1 30S ribosomal protein S16 [Bacteroidales bacterium]
MAVKIRLARHGRKARPFYHIVAADSRAPRDGKFIEKLGTYNPMAPTNKTEIKFDRALYWLQVGAEPTETVRNILQNEGVMYMNHLLGGVKKGAFDQAELEKRFQIWLDTKRKKEEDAVSKQYSSKQAALKKRLEIEKAINEKREQEIAKKNSELAAQIEAENAEKEEAEKPASEETEESKETETTDNKEEVVEAKEEPTAEEKTAETKEEEEEEKE